MKPWLLPINGYCPTSETTPCSEVVGETLIPISFESVNKLWAFGPWAARVNGKFLMDDGVVWGAPSATSYKEMGRFASDWYFLYDGKYYSDFSATLTFSGTMTISLPDVCAPCGGGAVYVDISNGEVYVTSWTEVVGCEVVRHTTWTGTADAVVHCPTTPGCPGDQNITLTFSGETDSSDPEYGKSGITDVTYGIYLFPGTYGLSTWDYSSTPGTQVDCDAFRTQINDLFEDCGEVHTSWSGSVEPGFYTGYEIADNVCTNLQRVDVTYSFPVCDIQTAGISENFVVYGYYDETYIELQVSDPLYSDWETTVTGVEIYDAFELILMSDHVSVATVRYRTYTDAVFQNTRETYTCTLSDTIESTEDCTSLFVQVASDVTSWCDTDEGIEGLEAWSFPGLWIKGTGNDKADWLYWITLNVVVESAFSYNAYCDLDDRFGAPCTNLANFQALEDNCGTATLAGNSVNMYCDKPVEDYNLSLTRAQDVSVAITWAQP